MATITIRTQLLNQTLDGARIIDMGSTKTCLCYVLPYDEVAEVSKEKLQNKYAFYVLLGKDSNGKNKAYIGQTNDFFKRSNDHKLKKHWWNKALVFVSKAQEIFASEVLYLEYLGWKKACDVKNFVIDNSNEIKEPSISPDKKNDMEMFFEEIMFLTRFYGCMVFDNPKVQHEQIGEILYLNVKKKGIKAEVLYNSESKKYTLLKGSTISSVDTSCPNEAKKIRKGIMGEPELCKQEGLVIKILQDCDISTTSGMPSGVAGVITGTSMQGTAAFKNKEGKTFAELFLVV